MILYVECTIIHQDDEHDISGETDIKIEEVQDPDTFQNITLDVEGHDIYHELYPGVTTVTGYIDTDRYLDNKSILSGDVLQLAILKYMRNKKIESIIHIDNDTVH
jgi:hypothetical protein